MLIREAVKHVYPALGIVVRIPLALLGASDPRPLRC
jgi:hypothetical protein